MISCTEFIPAYSELFAFLEKKEGKEGVDKFWAYLFKPDGKGIPLVNFVKKEGIKGCFTYWAGSLNEEAADFTMYLNEKAGWFKIVMHQCPSKGRLLKLKDEIGITPYPRYCLHCDSYRDAVKQVDLEYIYDFSGMDKASCSIFIYDPKIFNGKIIIDENTVIMDRRAGDNEYFHKDFHYALNNGVHYVGEKFGVDGLKEYLEQYTKNVYNKRLQDVKEKGLKAIEEIILGMYKAEKALDAVETTLTENTLKVKVKYCPVIKYLVPTGREISKWFKYVDQFVMPVFARAMGAEFSFNNYNEEDGSCEFTFKK